LARDEVHVWRADLTPGRFLSRTLRRLLSADEMARAKRFVHEGDRQRFIAARGALRDILARYLGTQPEQIRFCYDAFGKPALGKGGGETRSRCPDLQFNVTHAAHIALIAVASCRRVGVDVENVCSSISQDIVSQTFSTREQETWRSLPSHLRALGFFNCWTRKEAYLKARGEGLALSLDSFDVSLVPGEPARLLSVRDDTAEPMRWSIVELAPGPDHVAALAIEL
jgi:4'-phosphopantetheinyl transferase